MPAVTPALVHTQPCLTKMRSASSWTCGSSRSNCRVRDQCVVARRPSSSPAAPRSRLPEQNARYASLRPSRDAPHEAEHCLIHGGVVDAWSAGYKQRIDLGGTRQALRDPGDARRTADVAGGRRDRTKRIAACHLEGGDRTRRIQQLEAWKHEDGNPVHGRKGGQSDVAANTIGAHTDAVNEPCRCVQVEAANTLAGARDELSMNIGQAAQAAGLTAKMIRDYEALALIPQASRTDAGYRQYTQRDVEMLRFIRQARSVNFSIKQVEQLLALWGDTRRESRDVKAIVQAHMAELDRKMAELASMRASLEQMASRCPGDRTAQCPILSELSGDAEPAALPSQPRQRPPTVRARAHRVTARREVPSYAGLLAWSQALKGGLTAHHA